MSDLSLVTPKSLDKIKLEIKQLRRGSKGEHLRPHKLIMLLAVIELLERGEITNNRIYFRDPLLTIFDNLFGLVQKKDDLCQPGPPFFHLRSSGFWFHKIKPGKEQGYSKLKTTGGGTQLILDYIEYAYLRDDVFFVFSQMETREELRRYVVSLINPNENPKKSMNTKKSGRVTKRLETAFTETFSLSRPEIRQVLSVAINDPLYNDQPYEEALRQNTTLGTRQIKGMKSYCIGSGLLNFDYSITPFGLAVKKHDPLLEQIGTQWLMHYYLSAPIGPGPAFWHELITSRFRVGDQFTRGDLIEQINNFLIRTQNKQLSLANTIEPAITAFLGSYTKNDGLGKLNLLISMDRTSYRVQEPEPPPTWAVACALLNYWQTQFPGQTTINLNDLYGEKGFTNLFIIGKGHLNSMLEEMQQEGMIELYRIAPPYQVVLLQRDMEKSLERLYAS